MTGRALYKRLVFPWLAPITRWYLRKPRTYRHDGLALVIPPGVFHPGFFLSTQILLEHVMKESMQDKRLLELGAGSGLISLAAAKKGASVVASDISKAAENALQTNAANNQLKLEVFHSDLFENIPDQFFDYVVINPPYYPKRAENDAHHAWYCGPNFEYFEKLFAQLSERRSSLHKIIMILSEDCALDQIEKIALQHGWKLQKVKQIRKRFEWLFIFHLRSE